MRSCHDYVMSTQEAFALASAIVTIALILAMFFDSLRWNK